MEGKEGRKNAENYSGNKRQLIIHVVYNSFGSQKSQDIFLLHSKKKIKIKKNSFTVLPSLLYNVQWNPESQTAWTSQAKGMS